jgi:hypothetical protein
MDGKPAAFTSGSNGIVSAYYSGVAGRGEHLVPERALLLAVLADAIHCFLHDRMAHDRVGQQRFREAESWIYRRGRDWPFTFENVCDLLGIEAAYLRRKIIEKERSEKPAGPQPLSVNGSVKRRYSPKRVIDRGFVELLDRRR